MRSFLWLRDLICDMIHGTPLEGKVEAVKGWPHVDTSVAPKVPRGLVAAEARPLGQRAAPVAAGSKRSRHSSERSNEWLERIVGRTLPSTLHGRKSLTAAIPALSESSRVTPAQLYAQTGVRASSGAIEAASSKVASDTTTRLNLKSAEFNTLVAPQMRRVVATKELRLRQPLALGTGAAAQCGPLPSMRPGGAAITVRVPVLGGGSRGVGNGGGVHVPVAVGSLALPVEESRQDRRKRMNTLRMKNKRAEERKGKTADEVKVSKAEQTKKRKGRKQRAAHQQQQ